MEKERSLREPRAKELGRDLATIGYPTSYDPTTSVYRPVAAGVESVFFTFRTFW